MKQKYLTLFLVVLALCISHMNYSQSVLASSSGDLITDDFIMNWTLGETVTSTISGGNILTNGYHQPFTLCDPCLDAQISDSDFTILDTSDGAMYDAFFIYPNPVIQDMNLEFLVQDAGIWNLALYDATGKLVRLDQQFLEPNEKIQRTINASSLMSGIYYARLYTKGFSQTKQFQVYH